MPKNQSVYDNRNGQVSWTGEQPILEIHVTSENVDSLPTVPMTNIPDYAQPTEALGVSGVDTRELANFQGTSEMALAEMGRQLAEAWDAYQTAVAQGSPNAEQLRVAYYKLEDKQAATRFQNGLRHSENEIRKQRENEFNKSLQQVAIASISQQIAEDGGYMPLPPLAPLPPLPTQDGVPIQQLPGLMPVLNMRPDLTMSTPQHMQPLTDGQITGIERALDQPNEKV